MTDLATPPAGPATASHPSTRRRDAAEPGAVRGVNLLSPWVLRQLQVRRLRKRLVQALAALLVVAAGAWGFQQLQLAAARADLEGEVAAGDGLRLQISELTPVTSYVAEVRRRADAVRDAMSLQLDQGRTLAALRDAVPEGTRIDDLSFVLPIGPADDVPTLTEEQLAATRGLSTSCPGSDPFGTVPVVSCLTLTGTAPDRDGVAALVQTLARDPLFVEPFVDTTTTADGEVTFSGSVGLSPRAFTGRYDDLAPAPEATR
jgi:Tfp pilus assembly protein PilN